MKIVFVGALALFASCALAVAEPNHGHGGGSGGGARPAPHMGGGGGSFHGGGSRPSFSGSHGSSGRPSFAHHSSGYRPGSHGASFHHTPPRVIHIHGNTHYSSHRYNGYHRPSVAHHVVRHGSNHGVHVTVRGRSPVSLRRNFRSPHRYRFGAYRRPSGWYAHRWTYGQRLPRGWYGRDYWITDWSLFGLIAPPADYTWVRVGDDAVLIDADTGEIVQVAYDVFY